MLDKKNKKDALYINPVRLKVYLMCFVVLFLAWLQPYRIIRVEGYSMEPNFHNHSFVLAKLLSRTNEPLKKGDVVVIDKFAGTGTMDTLIKRVKYLPNERYYIIDWDIFDPDEPNVATQDVEYAENIRKHKKNIRTLVINSVVPPDKYFVEGDNQQRSLDSRMFGAVDVANIKYIVK